MESPTTSRREAVQKLMEAAGGKLIEMYSTVADGPGALVIFDVEPSLAKHRRYPAWSCPPVLFRNIKLMRLLTQDEVVAVRQTAKQLKDAYRPPGH